MFESLGISAVHPALLWGALGVAAPILIHLWNRRRLTLIDWAAMDFLFEAERRTRRRVQLENWLLLALRCLAVALVAALVARPYFAARSLAGIAPGAAGVERIVVLDDSPSMTARSGRGTLFDDAKTALQSMVQELDAAEASDTLTLVVTSQPQSPLVARAAASGPAAAELLAQLAALEPADLPARYDLALAALRSRLQTDAAANQALYVLTDGRARDWLAPADRRDVEPNPALMLRELAASATRCVFVDVAGPADDNLAVTDLVCADRALVAGVEARFEAAILNAGTRTVHDVEVRLAPSGGSELHRRVDQIGPGESAVVPFTYLFNAPGSAVLRAELAANDSLRADDQRAFAAVVRAGRPVLIVDGDPNAAAAKSESFFLSRALAPPGAAISGNLIETISESQFDDTRLDPYELICLLNPFRLSSARVAALEDWVRAGGGLLLALGDQTDDVEFNAAFVREGAGLSPLRLEGQTGIEASHSPRRLVVDAPTHPVMSTLDGAQNPLLGGVAFQRWWRAAVVRAPSTGTASTETALLARLDDEDRSPVIAERRFGAGRVMVFAFPLDADWCTWPSEPSYVLSMLEISRYLARESDPGANLIVGQRWRAPLDPAQYRTELRLIPPHGDPIALLAAPAALPERGLVAESEPLLRAGLYRVERMLRGLDVETQHFTVNLDARESDLRKADDAQLRLAFGDSPVEITHDAAALSGGEGRGKAEWRRPLVLGLAVLLCAEHSLAWWFGRRRQ